MMLTYLKEANESREKTGQSQLTATSKAELTTGELDFLDDEAERLYEWTQGLSLDALSTPRLSTSLMS